MSLLRVVRSAPEPRTEVVDDMIRVMFTDTIIRVEWDIPREFDRPIRTIVVELAGTNAEPFRTLLQPIVAQLATLTQAFAVANVNVEPPQVFLLPEP